MKDFLKILAMWIVLMFIGLFFLGDFFLSGRHVYGATLVLSLVLSLVPATVSYIFYRQSEELDRLRERVKKLEERLSPVPETEAGPGSNVGEQPEVKAEKP